MHSRFINRLLSAIALPAMVAMAACDQSSNIGQSVIDESISIVIDSAFTVSGKSVANNSVPSRTLTQLLGDIDIEGYGNVNSYFVSQFMPAANIRTDDVVSIDSIKLIMRVPTGDFIGDSIAPMGLTVYELKRDLPYPIFSDTQLNDYYNEQEPIGSRVYTMANFRLDSLSNTESTSYRELGVKLDTRLGQRLYDSYKTNPGAFSDPATFTSEIFKGLAVCNSFGSGRLTRIGQSIIRLYYTRQFYSEDKGADSIQHLSGNYFGVTPEIVTNNLINYTPSADMSAMVAAGNAVVASPAAYEVQMRFPAPEILAKYHSAQSDLKLINSLTMKLPVELIDNNMGINPPENLLMVLSSEKSDFFANNSLPDNETSFYASYNSTSKCYEFNDMRAYINKLAEKDKLEDSDFNFTLVPVTVTTTKSGSGYYETIVVSSVTPDVSTASAVKILLDEVKIIFAYSKQSMKY